MDKKIKHLGKLKGKVLLFGGVYSNLQALEGLIQLAKDKDIDPQNCICTGDIVGYCAEPKETVQLFQEWGAQSISGNVELQLSAAADDCGCDFAQGSSCDGFSKVWYPYAKRKLLQQAIDWMAQLPDQITFDYYQERIMVVHGSTNMVSEFIFESTPIARKKKSFETLESDVIIAGHSGLPFHQKLENKLWINAGAIGMPANDGTPRTWCVLMQKTEKGIEYAYHKIVYDFKKAHKNMVSERLPIEYAQTLISGLWHNMDILPEAEKRLKGIPYNFENKEENKYKTI
ncbi:MAG: metallophosphoesterase family protein [Flavobacteriaceae bacterium]